MGIHVSLTLCRRVGPATPWKVDVRLPGKGNSNSHGARPVLLIITMIKWIRTSRLAIKNSFSGEPRYTHGRHGQFVFINRTTSLTESSSLTPYWSESTLPS